MDTEESLRQRATVHSALGDAGRLAIMDMLVLSDAAPGELATRLGIGSNLLAHHLKVLEQAGAIRRMHSEGDRRRRYVTLVPETLEVLALGGEYTAPRVVFVCSRNSARSQLAAALWQRNSQVPVASAGTRPADRVHPGALATARRHGVTIHAPRTHLVADVARPDDLIVAVCDQAHEVLGEPGRLHWSIPDPVRVGTDEAFDAALDQLGARIARLASMVRRVRHSRAETPRDKSHKAGGSAPTERR